MWFLNKKEKRGVNAKLQAERGTNEKKKECGRKHIKNEEKGNMTVHQPVNRSRESKIRMDGRMRWRCH